jgi:hypothetical protein
LDSKSSPKPVKKQKRYKHPPGYKRPVQLLKNLKANPRKGIRKKICTLCKENKWLEDYYTNHKPGRGVSYRSECKACHTRRSTERINKTRKKKSQGGDPVYQAYQRAYYAKNREQFLEYRRKFLERNPRYFQIKNKQRLMRLKQEKIDAIAALNDKDCA